MITLKYVTRNNFCIKVFHDPNPHYLHGIDLDPDCDLTTQIKRFVVQIKTCLGTIMG